MQTIQLIETAKWITSQYSAETKKLIFTDRFPRLLTRAQAQTDSPNKTNTFLKASHEIAIVRVRLEEHPFAPQVLKAFNLEILLDEDFPIYLAERVAAVGMSNASAEDFIRDILHRLDPLWVNWPVLVGFIEPVETLTIPDDVANEKDFDEILTIELRYGRRFNPQAKDLAEALLNVTKLYEASSIASGKKEFDPLVVIFATSGTSFRFDFKGLGEPIKQLKGLFNDVWRNIRHRRSEDFRHNAKAIVEGLDLLSKVHSHQQKNILSSEEANRLRQQLNKSMLGLIETGALPREIPDVEPVNNKEIAQGIQQKLLPPAPPDAESKSPSKNGRKRSSKKRTRAASKKGKRKDSKDSDEKALYKFMNEDEDAG